MTFTPSGVLCQDGPGMVNASGSLSYSGQDGSAVDGSGTAGAGPRAAFVAEAVAVAQAEARMGPDKWPGTGRAAALL